MGGLLKRRWVRLLALAGVVLWLGAIWLPGRTDRITQANCGRIKKGMSEEEVEAILSRQGDYTGWPQAYSGATPEYWLLPEMGSGMAMKQWAGEEGLAAVVFGPDRRVISVWFWPSFHDSQVRRICDLLRKKLLAIVGM
jgi:hypothetical protein